MHTYTHLLKEGWKLNDIDNMDFIDYICVLAYTAATKVKFAYLKDVL